MTTFWIEDVLRMAPNEADYDYDSLASRGLQYESQESSGPQSRDAPLPYLLLTTSLMSIFASIVVVRISSAKLESAYQRIVFMLNIALVMNSIFLGMHPFLVDRNSGYSPAGTPASCTAMGFFLVFGSLAVSLYHTVAALYFYFSVLSISREYKQLVADAADKDGETPSPEKPSMEEKYCPGAEIAGNSLCLVLPLVISGAAISSGSFGYDPRVGLCTVYGAGYFGDLSWYFVRDIYRWTLVASGALTILVTLIIRIHVLIFEKKECSSGGDDDDAGDDKSHGGSSMTDPDEAEDEEEKEITRQKLKTISAQCLFYTTSYLSSYIWFVTLLFLSKGSGVPLNEDLIYAFKVMTVIFYPLLGVFNCAIYVRPRLQTLRIMYPQDSVTVSMRVAMSKAGDPEEIEEVRAKIYGDDYSRARESRDGTPADEDLEGGDANLSDLPSVVHFDPSCAHSVKSLVTTGEDEDTDKENGTDKDKKQDKKQSKKQDESC
ncbi:unnamed protein product [Pseudo-nitzschia multistriata]|uniref:G-protein coupled receptors family 1 profile domain-containing protein n=1 Tax=Pseudo-nitzschia multistriata TaxID=183589 RepID=A0A448Z0Z6_9STRA|nr:unnamed protein product [Pseudo-nitzschia multistriata]